MMQPSVTIELEVCLDEDWRDADPTITVMTVLTATGVESLTAQGVAELVA